MLDRAKDGFLTRHLRPLLIHERQRGFLAILLDDRLLLGHSLPRRLVRPPIMFGTIFEEECRRSSRLFVRQAIQTTPSAAQRVAAVAAHRRRHQRGDGEAAGAAGQRVVVVAEVPTPLKTIDSTPFIALPSNRGFR